MWPNAATSDDTLYDYELRVHKAKASRNQEIGLPVTINSVYTRYTMSVDAKRRLVI